MRSSDVAWIPRGARGGAKVSRPDFVVPPASVVRKWSPGEAQPERPAEPREAPAARPLEAPPNPAGPAVEERLRAEVEAACKSARAEVEAACEEALSRNASRLAGAVEELARLSAEIEASAINRVVDLACSVASRVIEREIAMRPETVADLARGVVGSVSGLGDIVLAVHPADAPVVERALADLRAAAGGCRVEILADLGLERGDCVARSAGCEADGRIATRIDGTREILRHSAAVAEAEPARRSVA